MQIAVERLNGETLELEVTPETKMGEVKEQLKRMHTWEDELSRDTALVDLIIGDKKVMSQETVEELSLSEDSKVTVVFKSNVVQCSNKWGYGPDLDRDALAIVKIPDSATEIEAEAFMNSNRVAQVIIPRSVTGIGDGALQLRCSLVSVTIPDSVRWIADGAFYGCSALKEVTIPNSITHIGLQAFAGCSSLVTVNIPNSVTQLGHCAFESCTSLVSVNIADSVRWIADGAFYACRALTEVTIPNSIRYIGHNAFAGCSSLAAVNIPDSVTWIEPTAFADCYQLTLTAPARLLGSHVSKVCKMVAKNCGCGRCDWKWFLKGWVCPVRHKGQ